MADKKINTDLDLNYNQIVKGRLENLTSAQRTALSLNTAHKGYEVFDTTVGIAFCWNGVGWVSMSGVGEANTASNVGTGTGIFKQKNVYDLELRSLTGTAGVTVEGIGDNINIRQTSSSGYLSSFANIVFNLENRTLHYTGGLRSTASISSAPEGVECCIILTGSGGDIRFVFPTGDFVEGGATAVDVLDGETIIIKVIKCNTVYYWTVSAVLTQI